MVLKFVIVLFFFFSFYENASSFKAGNSSLVAQEHRTSINVPGFESLKGNQDNNISSTTLKSTENVLDCSSGSWNSSSNCTGLLQAHFGNKNTEVNMGNETILPLGNSTSVDGVQHRLSTAIDDVQRRLPISVDGVQYRFSTSVESLFANSTSSSASVNAQKAERNTAIKSATTGQFLENATIVPSSKQYNIMIKNGSTTPIFPRDKRADSVQSVLKKIFPDEFFSTKPDSGRNRQKTSDSKFPNGTYLKNGRYNNGHTSKRKKKIQTGRFGEKIYFRAGDETTSSTGQGDSSTASTTGNGESSTGGSSTGESETGQSGAISSENTSSGSNVNYHYHFHYFGVTPPAAPSEKSTESSEASTESSAASSESSAASTEPSAASSEAST